MPRKRKAGSGAQSINGRLCFSMEAAVEIFSNIHHKSVDTSDTIKYFFPSNEVADILSQPFSTLSKPGFTDKHNVP